jgi:plastocyanin
MRQRMFVVSALVVMALVGTACGGSSGGSSGGATLEQGKGNQLVFSPTSLSVSSGSTITVKNVSDSTPHTFTIQGKKINVVNQPGKSATVTIDLPAGTYPFICTFHVSSGMKGTLTVTG